MRWPVSSVTRTRSTSGVDTSLISCRNPRRPSIRVSTAKPLFGVSDIGTGPSAVSIIVSGASPRAMRATIRPSARPGQPQTRSGAHGQGELPTIVGAHGGAAHGCRPPTGTDHPRRLVEPDAGGPAVALQRGAERQQLRVPAPEVR